MFKRLIHYLSLSLLVLIGLTVWGCTALNKHPAEKVVEEMYRAFSRGDMDGYMDTILPQNRRQPNPFGLLNAMSFSIGPVGFDVSKIMAVSIRDLKLKMLKVKDDYALVQAEGYVRYPIIMMEVRFCDQHDVRLQDGRWYVDVYAPERAQRLEKVLGIRQQELANMALNVHRATGRPGDELSTAVSIFGSMMEKTLDLCDKTQIP